MQPYYVKKNKNKLYLRLGVLASALLLWYVLGGALSSVFQDQIIKMSPEAGRLLSGEWFRNKSQLIAENEELKIRKMQLENDVADLKYKIKQLRSEDEMANKGRVDAVMAYSMGASTELIYDNFILNVGERDGVSSGAIVYTGGLHAIGRIDKVNNNSSTVRLLSADKVETNGIIDDTDDKIVLIGNGGGSFTTKVKKKSVDNGIRVGQIVRYSEEIDMALGEIVNIENNKDEDTSTLYIRGYYKPDGKALFFVDK